MPTELVHGYCWEDKTATWVIATGVQATQRDEKTPTENWKENKNNCDFGVNLLYYFVNVEKEIMRGCAHMYSSCGMAPVLHGNTVVFTLGNY